MISIDWPNKIIESDSSILDLPAFHATLRKLEDDAAGAIHPVTHRWKALDLGGGAFFYQADLINGYTLRFSGAGPFQISGNLKGPIVDTGVQVERTTSAAFSTTAVGGSGPSAESIAAASAAATVAALQAIFLKVDAAKMNGADIIGDGSEANPWRGVGVQP
jgi:hypothetical protein